MMRLLNSLVARMRGREGGLTLIETLAAIFIFAIITIGVVPLLASALRGATLSRSYTVGKETVVKQMERSRGLPYYVAYASQNRKVDVLDLFFPCFDPTTQTGCNAGGGTYLADGPDGDPATVADNYMFRTVCTPGANSTNMACPSTLPESFVDVTFEAQFVQADINDAGSLLAVAPSSTYVWNATPQDAPPAFLLRLGVVGRWLNSGQTRTFSVSSVLGDRRFGPERVSGAGKVDYAVSVLTAFKNLDTPSDLSATVGISESRIASRLLSEADQVGTAADLRISREATETSAAQEIASFVGATTNHHAPPDSDPATEESKGQHTLLHPDILKEVAFVDDTDSDDIAVKVAGELPTAEGSVRVSPAGSLETQTYDFWTTNQTIEDAPLLLDLATPVFTVRPVGEQTLGSRTTATTGALGASHSVQTTASAAFGEARLFPVTFIPVTEPKRAVIVIEPDSVTDPTGFSASVDCTAHSSELSAKAEAIYSATLKFWKETDPNDGNTAGGYSALTLSSSNASDPLQQYGIGPGQTNPLVYEDPLSVASYGSASDVYLFEVTHNHDTDGDGVGDVTHKHPGYLTSWTSLKQADMVVNKERAGRVTSASVDGAIRINTRPTNPTIPESGLNISIGKLSCEAVENR